MTRDEVIRLAREAGFDPGTTAIEDWLERFYALAVADERARIPQPPLVVDVSRIDPGELADAMKRARPDSAPVLVPVQPTRKQHIDALVGDRLTADKADHICERYGYAVPASSIARLCAGCTAKPICGTFCTPIAGSTSG